MNTYAPTTAEFGLIDIHLIVGLRFFIHYVYILLSRFVNLFSLSMCDAKSMYATRFNFDKRQSFLEICR